MKFLAFRIVPTGTAAVNIDGGTYHGALGIGLGRKQNSDVSARIKRLWENKTILVIDEISMTDLSILATINRHCKSAKAQPKSSPDLFGGLPVVILAGDFLQFPPVRGRPLWMDPRPLNDDEAEGHRIWRRFDKVVILDEQMRQAKDPAFQSFLGRARSGSLTQNDVDLLNTKVVSSVLSPDLDDATFIVQRNSLRHSLTHCRLQHFASIRSQFLYIFPAEHSRTKSSSKLQLRLEDLLLHPDDGTKCPFPGLFVYTEGMPIMLLANLSTKMGQVNGSIGTAVGIGIDSTATFLQFDHRTILCTKPPTCVFFKPDSPKHPKFHDLDSDIFPIFPIERSVQFKDFSVRRKQVPLCPAFCLTDYKVQGKTLSKGVVDLKNDPSIRFQDSHRKYIIMEDQLFVHIISSRAPVRVSRTFQ
jgi:PIF1-like helicase